MSTTPETSRQSFRDVLPLVESPLTHPSPSSSPGLEHVPFRGPNLVGAGGPRGGLPLGTTGHTIREKG